MEFMVCAGLMNIYVEKVRTVAAHSSRKSTANDFNFPKSLLLFGCERCSSDKPH